MNWRYEAIFQLVFSSIPFGERMKYFFQRKVTKSLAISVMKCENAVSLAKEYIDMLNQYGDNPLEKAYFYEFGAGWNLFIPLSFYAFGIEHQTVVDIRNLLRPKLVNETIEKFQELGLILQLPRKPKQLIGGKNDLLGNLKKYYGIEYRAPCDSRNTGLKNSSIDYITSTNTLEHIPPRDIPGILHECYRVLRDNGLMILRIDYQDHYAYFDRSISVYNFLQYSDRKWKLFNAALHYQNRLKLRDYIDLFKEEGFEILRERRLEGSEGELETIKRFRIDKRFKGYSPEELITRNSVFVLSKARSR